MRAGAGPTERRRRWQARHWVTDLLTDAFPSTSSCLANVLSRPQQIDVLDAQKIEDLRVLGIKSIVFASGSFALYLYAWFIFISHPYNYQINVVRSEAPQSTLVARRPM